MPFAATCMDTGIIILHGVILTDKDKYDVAYMQNLKKKIQMNLFTSKQIHRLRELTYGYQGGGVGGIDCKFEIDMYTLMCIKLMPNKNLQYKKTNKQNN